MLLKGALHDQTKMLKLPIGITSVSLITFQAHSNSIFPLNSSDHEKLQSMVSTISEQNVDTASSKGIMSTMYP